MGVITFVGYFIGDIMNHYDSVKDRQEDEENQK
jgi:hypothetical protein